MECLRTKKNVRTFLGMTGYYWRFIITYDTIAEPLTNLTKKGKPDITKWTENAKHAFESLKEAVTSASIMSSPDFTKTFVMQTDTSNVRKGLVLSKRDEDYSIAYLSRKLLDREKWYSVIEQECLSIVLGIEAFEVYLIGKPFVLQTDHRALHWIQQCTDKNARLMQWSLMLQTYTFTVQHRKGSQNANTDALSHLPLNYLDQETNGWKKWIKEATYIRTSQSTISTDPGLILNPTWTSLLDRKLHHSRHSSLSNRTSYETPSHLPVATTWQSWVTSYHFPNQHLQDPWTVNILYYFIINFTPYSWRRPLG